MVPSKFDYKILSLPKSSERLVDITPQSRIRDAALLAIAVGATETLARVAARRAPASLIKKLHFIGLGSPTGKVKLFNAKTFVPNVAAATIFGSFSGNLRNAVAKSKMDVTLKDQAIKEIEKAKKAANVPSYDSFEKKAKIGKTVSSAVSAIAHTDKVLGYGLLPMGGGRLGRVGRRLAGRKTPFPLSHKLYGAAIKGGTIAGAYVGGKAIYKKLSGDDTLKDGYTKEDYTAHLRNNLLAGHIKPEELSVEEMESVRNRGME